jgi:hypothetical protein
METAILKEMAVKSMETAVEAMASMEMALGALPHLGRVPEQRLLSPKFDGGGGGAAGLLLENYRLI